MPLQTIRNWLGVETRPADDLAPLRETLEALDHLPAERARYLGAFAFLLGRVAHADSHVSPEETRAMEALVEREGGIARDQAMVVVQLAKANQQLFTGMSPYLIAREFDGMAGSEQKLALMRCLFAVAATDASISLAEEGEIHRIAQELHIDRADLVALRIAHRDHLPGVK